MISLTRQQRALLSFIESYLAKHNGVAPSFDEMREALGLKSRSGIHRLISALEERGLIRRPHNRARAIELVPENPLADVPSFKLIVELHRRGIEVLPTPVVLTVAA